MLVNNSFTQGVAIYFFEAKAIFLLSLWKVYVGPALGVGFDMNYIEAVGYTMLGASVTVFTTLYFERYVTRFFRWLSGVFFGRITKRSPKFNGSLRKALVFYRRYGFWGLMALAPILIGLPIGVWIAVRLGTSRQKVVATALLMSMTWSSISYFVTLNGVEQLAG